MANVGKSPENIFLYLFASAPVLLAIPWFWYLQS